jgi:hypothetical protein
MINILITVDTGSLKNSYPTPSQDSNNPTAITTNCCMLICSSPRGVVSGQGTENIALHESMGDQLHLGCVPIDQICGDGVIIYEAQPAARGFFQNIGTRVVQRSGAMPAINSDSPIPPVLSLINSISLTYMVMGLGNGTLNTFFALYTSDNGTRAQQLFGYFSTNISLSIAH